MSAPPRVKIDLNEILYRAQELIVRTEARLTKSRAAIERSRQIIEAFGPIKDRPDC